MANDYDIASLALTRIGHTAITSFSASGDKAQRWFYSNFDFIKSSLLREHPWNFAIKRAALVATTAPVNGFANAYTLPNDFLRMVRLNDSLRGYRIEGQTLVSDESAATIEYVYDVSSYTNLPDFFVDLLAARFSAEICFYLTDNTQLTEQCWKVYQEKLDAARRIDSQEARPTQRAASLAFARLGIPRSRATDGSAVAYENVMQFMDDNYTSVKRAVLREFPWRFAIKRAVLTADTILDITAATAANPVVITAASHGFSNGDTVYISGVIGMTEINNRTFTVANATASTIELSGENGLSHSAYASGGKLYGYIASEYGYRFPVPSDCQRVLRINNTEADDYRVEGAYVYTDEATCQIEYIWDVQDEDTFDFHFTDVLAQRLVAEAMYAVTNDLAAQQQAWRVYQDKLSLARTMDSRQGMPRPIEADTWLNTRA